MSVHHKVLVIRKVSIKTACACGTQTTLGTFCKKCNTEVAIVLDYLQEDVIGGGN